MPSAVVPFNFATPATNLAKRRETSANTLFLSANAPSFPVLSIKGKVWTMVKGDTRRILTRKLTGEDGTIEEVPITTIPLAVIAGNPKARVFYAKGFTEGDEQGQKPTCYTHDGQRPDAQAAEPQAKNCQTCAQAAWGSKVRNDDAEAKGTACSPRIRLAVADPANPATPFRLDVPPGSASNWRGAIALIENHGKDFDQVAFKVSFDVEAATPKLVFTPHGFLGDDAAAAVQMLKTDQVVVDILGVPSPRAEGAEPEVKPAAAPAPAEKPKAKPVVTTDELEGALAGVVLAPAAEPAKPTVPKPRAEAKPKPAPKTEAAPVAAASSADDLLGGLASLLEAKDD